MTHQGVFEVGFCMRPSTGFRSAWFSSWTMMLIQKTDAVTLSSGRNIFAGPSSPQERELSVLTTCVMHLRNNRLGSTHLSNELSKTLMQSPGILDRTVFRQLLSLEDTPTRLGAGMESVNVDYPVNELTTWTLRTNISGTRLGL